MFPVGVSGSTLNSLSQPRGIRVRGRVSAGNWIISCFGAVVNDQGFI